MAKINVYYSNFPFTEINVFNGVLSIKTRMFQLFGETIGPAEFLQLELASEQRVNQICGEHWRSVVGEVLTAKLETLAGGIVTGLCYETMFALTFKDGRCLIGTVETYAWYEMEDEMAQLHQQRSRYSPLVSSLDPEQLRATGNNKSVPGSHNEDAFDALLRRVNAARHAGNIEETDIRQ